MARTSGCSAAASRRAASAAAPCSARVGSPGRCDSAMVQRAPVASSSTRPGAAPGRAARPAPGAARSRRGRSAPGGRSAAGGCAARFALRRRRAPRRRGSCCGRRRRAGRGRPAGAAAPLATARHRRRRRRRPAPGRAARAGAGAGARCRRRTSSPGVGRSATWQRRISTISAAARRSGACSTSADALQQHLPGAPERRGSRAGRPRRRRGCARLPAGRCRRAARARPAAGSACGPAPAGPAARCRGRRRARAPVGDGAARRPVCPAMTASIRSNTAVRSARPSMSATSAAARPLAAGLGDRLVQQRQPVAGRAVGGAGDQVERRRARSATASGRRDPAEQPGQLGRPRCGAGRSAGSATARSPAPCGFRWWRR